MYTHIREGEREREKKVKMERKKCKEAAAKQLICINISIIKQRGKKIIIKVITLTFDNH